MTTHIREPTHLSISSNSLESVVQSFQAGNAIELYREVGAGKSWPEYPWAIGTAFQIQITMKFCDPVESYDIISMCTEVRCSCVRV